MTRNVKSMEDKYLQESVDLVEKVFTEWANEEEGKYEDELLLLTPVAVKTELQRQHISKDIIEHGFEIAKEMRFTVVLVEGNPQNYRSRGFDSSYKYGIEAGSTVNLPHPDCLMVKELEEGALERIGGLLDYSFYEALH
ncbi:MAG: hypothetical protein IJ958_00030 [Agathobacter sp.]|nr:hypothetical protein [Agathobacter sp.]